MTKRTWTADVSPGQTSVVAVTVIAEDRADAEKRLRWYVDKKFGHLPDPPRVLNIREVPEQPMGNEPMGSEKGGQG